MIVVFLWLKYTIYCLKLGLYELPTRHFTFFFSSFSLLIFNPSPFCLQISFVLFYLSVYKFIIWPVVTILLLPFFSRNWTYEKKYDELVCIIKKRQVLLKILAKFVNPDHHNEMLIFYSWMIIIVTTFKLSTRAQILEYKQHY